MRNDDSAGGTIGAALDRAAERYGEELAYVFANGDLTYTHLKETSDLLARGFLGLRVKKGDPVAIWIAGYAEWAFVYFALARIGAIMVPVNTRYRPDEIKYVLKKSKAAWLVFKEEPNKDFCGILEQLFEGGAFTGSLDRKSVV